MQNSEVEKISREEIIKYVDELIAENKDSYDKKLAPLLYEFFLRANEKFEWTKQEFLDKYENFWHRVKNISFKKLGKYVGAEIWYRGKEINFNETTLKIMKKNTSTKVINLKIIDSLFHEGLHATDFYGRDGKLLSAGLNGIIYNHTKDEYSLNNKDTMLNEYANVLSSSLIASDKPMYEDDLGINVIKSGSYDMLNLPGSIMCAAFDITEIEMAKFKDKGKRAFDLYLEDKFPYLNLEQVMDVFKSNLNVIYNANMRGDKANTAIGLGNIVDTALNIINIRMNNIPQEELHQESIERSYYDIYKIEQLLQKLDGEYRLKAKNEVYTFDRNDSIEELFGKLQKYRKLYNLKEFDIGKIAKKYYVKSNEPLNDNTELIEQVRMSFKRPTIKEMIQGVMGKAKIKVLQEAKNTKELVAKAKFGEEIVASQISNKKDFKNRIKHETPIIVNKHVDKQMEEKTEQNDKGETRE